MTVHSVMHPTNYPKPPIEKACRKPGCEEPPKYGFSYCTEHLERFQQKGLDTPAYTKAALNRAIEHRKGKYGQVVCPLNPGDNPDFMGHRRQCGPDSDGEYVERCVYCGDIR